MSIEWNGEGLPPVGWKGEYTKPSGFIGRTCVWRWCFVVAHDCGGVLVRTDKGRYHLLTVPEYEFRPLRTPEQRLRDKVVSIICEDEEMLPETIADTILATYELKERE